MALSRQSVAHRAGSNPPTPARPLTIVGPTGQIRVAEFVPDHIPASVRRALADCEVSAGPGEPSGQFAIHAKAPPGNPYDGHTLAKIIPAIEQLVGNQIERLHADARYHGRQCWQDASDQWCFTRMSDGPLRSTGRISNSTWTIGSLVLLKTV